MEGDAPGAEATPRALVTVTGRQVQVLERFGAVRVENGN